MISEIDIKDWDRIDIDEAYQALGNAYLDGMDRKNYAILFDVLWEITVLRKKYVPQVAALFKEKNDGI